MRRTVLTKLAAAAVLAASTVAADAKCTRLGFSVNDYGKDGPTRDAKKLLDQYIAKWAAENGIKKYSVGKKDVKCELYLDLLLFDEHTCRAEASVCWDASPVGTSTRATKAETPIAPAKSEGPKAPPAERGQPAPKAKPASSG